MIARKGKTLTQKRDAIKAILASAALILDAAAPATAITVDAGGTQVIAKAVAEKLGPDLSRDIPLETNSARDGQRVFGYNTGTLVCNSAHRANEDRSLVRDPIVVVVVVVVMVPNGSEFLTSDAYATFATQEGVVFTDPGDVLRAIESKGPRDYVPPVSPVGQRIALEVRDAVGISACKSSVWSAS